MVVYPEIPPEVAEVDAKWSGVRCLAQILYSFLANTQNKTERGIV